MQTRRTVFFLIPLLVIGAIPTPSVAWGIPIVYFDQGSAEISPDAERVIAYAVQSIRDGAVRRVTIFGYADFAEADTHALSLRRAEAVRDAMHRMGLPGSFPLEVQARDTNDPAVPNPTDERRIENRRAVLAFDWDCNDRQRYVPASVCPPEPAQ